MATSMSVPAVTERMSLRDLRDQLHHGVYLEEHAEHLYQTCALCERLGARPLTWEQLPAFEKARFISAAAQAVESMTAVSR